MTLTPEQQRAVDADVTRRSERLRQMMDEWIADESDYDERTWAKLKPYLDGVGDDPRDAEIERLRKGWEEQYRAAIGSTTGGTEVVLYWDVVAAKLSQIRGGPVTDDEASRWWRE